jgi:X-Pro dipeptidyl-peptidase
MPPGPPTAAPARRGGAPTPPPTPYADYPNPAAAFVTLRLQAAGETDGSLNLSAPSGQGMQKLVDDVQFGGPALAAAASSPNRLLYSTPELVQPLHLSGTSTITVRLSSSKPAANLSVWMVVLPWTNGPIGPGNLITRGWADPQNHRSLTAGGNYKAMARGEPLVPGRFVTLTFSLQPDDQIIPAGKRVGLMIFSSDRDFTLWPQPGTELAIDLDATNIRVPVVGGVAGFRAATGTR